MYPKPLLYDFRVCNNPRDANEEAFTQLIHVRNIHGCKNPIYLNEEAYPQPILDGDSDASMRPSDLEDDDQYHG